MCSVFLNDRPDIISNMDLMTKPVGFLQVPHSVHSPPLPQTFWGVGGGLNLQPNFQKGGLDRTSVFRGGLLGKRGVTFFRGG